MAGVMNLEKVLAANKILEDSSKAEYERWLNSLRNCDLIIDGPINIDDFLIILSKAKSLTVAPSN